MIPTQNNNNCLDIKTVLENLKKIPHDQFRANKYKVERESWCVAKMLEHLSLHSYLVCANPVQADSADIFVINSDQQYKIQVTEIAPKHQNAQVAFSDALIHGYSTLTEQTSELLQAAVSEKEIYSDIENLNLLIYFNTPVGEAISDTMNWAVLLDNNLDFDFPQIKQLLAGSKFSTILLLTSDGVVFIKNDKLI